MVVSFDSLPEQSKVWIYIAARKLTPAEIEQINTNAGFFLSTWESHNIPVQGSIDILDDQFIRVSAFTDEDAMCGRAQDAQVRFIKEAEEALGIEFTNRMILAFEHDGKIITQTLDQLESSIQSGIISEDSIYFNNLVNSKQEFSENWKSSPKETWLQRYF